MRYLFSTILSWLQWMVGIVPRHSLRSPVLYRVLHYTAVAVIALLLAYFSNGIFDFLHQRYNWDKPDPNRLYKPVVDTWAGCLFLLTYLFVRLLVYLITLLRIQDELEFPDIARDWQAGVDALRERGIDPRDLPLFVVNGLTAEEERGFFAASRMGWKLVAPPEARPAVLRFYANEEGLFVSCNDVGATSRQLKNTGAPAGAGGGVLQSLIEGSGLQESPAAARGTLRPRDGVEGGGGGGAPPVAAPSGPAGTLRRIQSAIGSLGTLIPGWRQPKSEEPRVRGALVKLSPSQRDVCDRRIRFLTELILADRAPFCPINGLLQSQPCPWGGHAHEATMLSEAVGADLAAFEASLGLVYPVTLVVPAVDQLDGFAEFVERSAKIDPRIRDSRAGSGFPAGAPIEPRTCDWVIQRGMQWWQMWVYKAFAIDLDHPGNRQLYRLLGGLRERHRRLESQVQGAFRMVAEESGQEPPRLSGWYFATTAPDATRQGFVRGIFQKLVQEQDAVAWSRGTLQRDRRAKAMAVGILLAALALGGIGTARLFWPQGGPGSGSSAGAANQ